MAPRIGQIPAREESRFTAATIRAVDIAGAVTLLVLLFVPLLIIAIVIRIDSKGSPLFRQHRLGRRQARFKVVKLRTMRDGAPADRHRDHVVELIASDGRTMAKLERDGRVTRIGALLRRTSIDELPQLWNVLRGDMSLVGPRPPIQYEVDNYPPEAFGRFAVKPGLTGLWQVSGRSLLSFSEMIDLDLEYVERRSVWLNVKILLLTPPVVIKGSGAA